MVGCNALLLEGCILIPASYYCMHKAQTCGHHRAYHSAIHLRNFLSELLSDHNEWQNYDSGDPQRIVAAGLIHNSITDTYLSGYLTRYSHGNARFSTHKPVKNSSVIQRLITIQDFYHFCYEYGFSPKKFVFSGAFERYEKRQTTNLGIDLSIHDLYYNKETFQKLVGYLQTKNAFLCARDTLICYLGYYSGIRPHEVLKYGNFTRRRLEEAIPQDEPYGYSAKLVISGKGKGDGKEREIVLPPQVCKPFKNFLYRTLPAHEDKFSIKINGCVFTKTSGEALKSPSYFNNHIWTRAKNALIANENLSAEQAALWKKRNFYSTRHCYATNFVIQQRRECKTLDQIALKQLMGHERFDTTLASYIFLAAVLLEDEKLKEVANAMADEDKMANYAKAK